MKTNETAPKSVAQVIKEEATRIAPGIASKVIVASIGSAEAKAEKNKTQSTKNTTTMKSEKDPVKEAANKAAEAKKNAAAEAEALQKEIERKTAELQERLKDLAHRQELSNHRRKFIETLDQLAEAKKDLEAVTDFETRDYKISFSQGYSPNAVFSISARAVVLDFINHLNERITLKVAEIEDELLK